MNRSPHRITQVIYREGGKGRSEKLGSPWKWFLNLLDSYQFGETLEEDELGGLHC